MDDFQIFGLQLLLSFVVYALIARWYVAPRLAGLPVYEALVPLVFTHCFRHLGMVVLVPTVVDPKLPRDWTLPLAYGDLTAQLLAIVSVVALRKRSSVAIPLVWVFNIVGAADLVVAYVRGAMLQVYRYNLDSAWYITTFVGPALLITHAMVFWILVKGSPRG